MVVQLKIGRRGWAGSAVKSGLLHSGRLVEILLNVVLPVRRTRKLTGAFQIAGKNPDVVSLNL